jgi:hypothetical protein
MTHQFLNSAKSAYLKSQKLKATFDLLLFLRYRSIIDRGQ